MQLIKWRPAVTLLAGLVMLGGIAISSCQSGGAKRAAPPPPSVQVIKAQSKTVPIYQEYLGQTAAVNPVEILSQVTGPLWEIAFREGSTVKKGQLLFVIDPRPYQAALKQAKANLAQAQAALGDDQKNLERDKILYRENVLARQQLDTQTAQTEEAKATVEADQAAVETAALNLSYTKIFAPLAGNIGIAQVKVGALVQANNTVLDTIYSINPIYVDFSVTERAYLDYEEAALREHSAPTPSLQLILPNNTVYPHKGTIVMANPTVSANTGTLGLRAEFRNPEGLLRPGLFVRVRAVVSKKVNAVLVPEQAIEQVQGQQSVYVVGTDNKAEFRPVKTGPTVAHMTVVDSGVQAGDQVIVEGGQKVRPGMVVMPIMAAADHVAESQTVVNGGSQ
ncbi:MAG: efflux RND transporter periplasmic adaptor subunit [Candidatus Binataceae bacterium]